MGKHKIKLSIKDTYSVIHMFGTALAHKDIDETEHNNLTALRLKIKKKLDKELEREPSSIGRRYSPKELRKKIQEAREKVNKAYTPIKKKHKPFLISDKEKDNIRKIIERRLDNKQLVTLIGTGRKIKVDSIPVDMYHELKADAIKTDIERIRALFNLAVLKNGVFVSLGHKHVFTSLEEKRKIIFEWLKETDLKVIFRGSIFKLV